MSAEDKAYQIRQLTVFTPMVLLPKQIAAWVLTVLFVATLSTGMTVVTLLLLSLPQEQGEITLAGLGTKVTIDFDAHGVPTISANNRSDAYRALGWLHASRRLFQMDLNRRRMAGTLSAILGPATVSMDVTQRRLGLSRVAGQIVDRLPPEQRARCSAYAQGVNAWLSRLSVLPPEFLALGYRPAPWSCQDTLLVILSMFQVLDEIGDQERMLTVMYHTLPEELVDFLTPDTDPLDTLLLGKPCGHRPTVPTPVKAIRALMARHGHQQISGLVTEPSPAGSTCPTTPFPAAVGASASPLPVMAPA